MDKQVLLMKLLQVGGGIRQEQRGNKEHCCKGMSPIARDVLCLLLKEGNLNQRTIAKIMKVTGQAVSELMKKLECKELITRKQGEWNNENIISLTPKGLETATQLQDKIQEMAECRFTNFTEEEMNNLFALLEKIENNAQAL